jgi:hypothetical protein
LLLGKLEFSGVEGEGWGNFDQIYLSKANIYAVNYDFHGAFFGFHLIG